MNENEASAGNGAGEACDAPTLSNYGVVSVTGTLITVQVTSNQPVTCEAFARLQGIGEYEVRGTAELDTNPIIVVGTVGGPLSGNTNYEIFLRCTNQAGVFTDTNILVVRTRRER